MQPQVRSEVALFTRAWIEIFFLPFARPICAVALFTRAWIEIFQLGQTFCPIIVALFTRAWIEMPSLVIELFSANGRPLYEGVD